MERRSVDVAVLSDLHLGTYGCRAKEIAIYLKNISPQLLILNGDIIDIWQFSKHYFPPAHMDVVKEIFNLLAKGTRVIYITGNHDEILRKYTDLNLGNFQLKDKIVIEIDGRTTWIFHGDAFDNTTKGGAKFWARLGSNGYAILLGFNRTINSLLKMMGRDPVSLSKKIMHQLNKSIIHIDKFEIMVAEIAIEKKYDYVICSHIHQPQKRIVENENGTVTYLNSGDWVEHLTALEYYDKDWHIYHYKESLNYIGSSEPVKITTEVIPDEISYYLHSLNSH